MIINPAKTPNAETYSERLTLFFLKKEESNKLTSGVVANMAVGININELGAMPRA